MAGNNSRITCLDTLPVIALDAVCDFLSLKDVRNLADALPAVARLALDLNPEPGSEKNNGGTDENNSDNSNGLRCQ